MIFSYQWNLCLWWGEIGKREVACGIVVKLDLYILVLLLPFSCEGKEEERERRIPLYNEK
jgi:hypothetical protein